MKLSSKHIRFSVSEDLNRVSIHFRAPGGEEVELSLEASLAAQLGMDLLEHVTPKEKA